MKSDKLEEGKFYDMKELSEDLKYSGLLTKQYYIFRSKDNPSDIMRFLFQLVHPDSNNPTYRLHKIIEKYEIKDL